MAVNLAGLDDTLFTDALFGHERSVHRRGHGAPRIDRAAGDLTLPTVAGAGAAPVSGAGGRA